MFLYYTQELPCQDASSAIPVTSTPAARSITSTPLPPLSEYNTFPDDLFSAHDFDIQIDLPTATQGLSSICSLHLTNCVVPVKYAGKMDDHV